jgi:16S rRNA (uracil1498-N3)-methyltransferase
MSQRFFVESPIGDAPTARLVDAEAQHLVKVMRAKPGDDVTLFDGSGWEFTGRVSAVGRSAVDLEIVERRQIDRELSHPLTLAVSLPKGDRQKVLVEKLVELGVTRLIPLDTQRGVAEGTPAALIRLRRQVIEASKQCGRNRLMEIAEPLSLPQLIQQAPFAATAPAERGPLHRILAHPSGRPLTHSDAVGPAVIAIGPEGGFTDDEVAAADRSGWKIVSLGPRILRIETAALALAALLAKQ